MDADPQVCAKQPLYCACCAVIAVTIKHFISRTLETVCVLRHVERELPLFCQISAIGSFKDLKIDWGNATRVIVIKTFKTEVHKGSCLLFVKIRMFGVPWVMNPPPQLFHSFSWIIFQGFLLTGFIRRLLWVESLFLINHFYFCLNDSSAFPKSAVSNSYFTKT